MADSIIQIKILEHIHVVLLKIEERLKVIEESVKKEKKDKELLNG